MRYIFFHFSLKTILCDTCVTIRIITLTMFVQNNTQLATTFGSPDLTAQTLGNREDSKQVTKVHK